jgi:hypothetical protein
MDKKYEVKVNVPLTATQIAKLMALVGMTPETPDADLDVLWDLLRERLQTAKTIEKQQAALRAKADRRAKKGVTP